MKNRALRRILALFLVLTTVLGCIPAVGAASTSSRLTSQDYATPATQNDFESVSKWFAGNAGYATKSAYAKIVNGAVYTWGNNAGYVLGLPDVANNATVTVPTMIPKSYFGNENVVMVGIEYNAAYAVTESGQVYVWGASNKFLAASCVNAATPQPVNMGEMEQYMENDDWSITQLYARYNYGMFAQDSYGNWYSLQGGSNTYSDVGADLMCGEEYTRRQFNKISDKIYEQLGTDESGQQRTIKKIVNTSRKSFILTDDGIVVAYGANMNNDGNKNHPIGLTRLYDYLAYNGRGIYDLNNKVYLDVNGDVIDNQKNADGTFNYEVIEAATDAQHKCARVSEETESDMRGLKIKDIVSDGDYGILFIDENGDVWGIGSSRGSDQGNRLGVTSNYVFDPEGNYVSGDGYYINDRSGSATIPKKIFDHQDALTKAACAVFGATGILVIGENNSVWMRGANNAQMLDQSIPADTNILEMTEVATNITTKYTIVGASVCPTDVMLLTSSGDMIFMGDNKYGGAGNGTNTNDGIDPGSPEISEPTTLPPGKPTTLNEVSFGIETTDADGAKVEYTPDPTSTNANRVKKTYLANFNSESGSHAKGETVTEDSLTLTAGRTFKLNVYFNDFGKLNTFTMPIRFNSKYVQVANGAGESYADDGSIITPGSLGESVGIQKCFTSETWPGGILAGEGGVSGTYPKISNGGGWVAVQGTTYDGAGTISSKTKMFSINFVVKARSENAFTQFKFATEDNAYEGATGTAYDEACLTGTAHWTVVSSTSELYSTYSFNSDTVFPSFKTNVVALTGLGAELYYITGAGSGETAVSPYSGEDQYKPLANSRVINWKNKDVEYIVRSSPTPSNASYPQVEWSISLLSFDPAFVESGLEVEDYITITEQTDSYVRFKVAESLDPTQSMVAAVKFVATAKMGKGTQTEKKVELNAVLTSLDAPARIRIHEKNYSSGDVPSITEVIYHYTNKEEENKKFNLDYYKNNGTTEDPNYVLDNSNTTTSSVIWTLTDSEGNPIDMTDTTAKVTLGNAVNQGTNHYVVIAPHYTTPGETYVTLTATSLYDSSVSDSIKIKVHLYTTDLEATQEIIRVPIESSKDLSQFIKSAPQDVYEQDLSWSISAVPETSKDPANLAGKTDEGLTWVPGTDYATLGNSTATASTIYTYDWATPVDDYVYVTVTDRYNTDATVTLKVCIMDIDAPFGIDDVEVTNALGDADDTVTIGTGLQVGDTVIIYARYEDVGVENDPSINKITIVDLKESKIINGAAKFMVSGLLDSAGGEIGIVVKRKVNEDDSVLTAFTAVPVSYGAEPSEVKGYVRLFGRSSTSTANEGIRIDLVGANYSETVFTKEGGFFRFTKYIAPGYYTMTISCKNYLTRVIEKNVSRGYLGLKIEAAEEFYISTEDNPIYLYPGDVTNDSVINIQDLTYYLANWVGQSDQGLTGFASFNFDDTGKAAINTADVALLLMRKDWVCKSYPVWNIPAQP